MLRQMRSRGVAKPQRMAGRILFALCLMALFIATVGYAEQTGQAAAPTFADPAFQRTWERTDKPVADGTVKRGYYWGPQPFDKKQEQYAEGQGGARLVHYFDKSRMEINNPNGDKSSPFYVTNGLLTYELVTGKLQIGNEQFVQRPPAEIPLASDNDDTSAPTYATFTGLMQGALNLTGQKAVTTVDRSGKTRDDASLGSTFGAELVHFEKSTQHNIPDIFWEFLNASGTVYENGKQTQGQISNPWYYASGLPITEPYWTHVKIAGQANTLVMIQLYERRVLTYVPSAQFEFRVQVGNIGRHYYDWRYNNAGKPVPTATPPSRTTPTPRPTLGPTGLSVFAASSLTEAFTEAGQQFKAANPNVTDLRFNFQGSQALVAQIQQGAPADVFASADKTNMDNAVQAGLIEGSPMELLRNKLVVVLPNENFGSIATLKDLAKPGIKLSLADPAVPVGKYSLAVLDKLAADPAYGEGFKKAVLDNVVSREDNVRQVLTRVQLGEVDAGIVYVTDATAANATTTGGTQPVKTLAIPDKYNVIAVYYIATVKGATHPQAAQAWINYLLSPGGQNILAKYGFAHPANTP